MKVLIVGAGIAGLSTAIFLEKKGIEVKLIERESSLSDLGFTLGLYPNSTFLLKELGIFDEIKKHSMPFKFYEIWDSHGHFLFDINFEQFNKKGEREGLILERGILHSALAKKYGNKKIHFETEIRQIKESENHVEVRYKDGKEEKFDFIVGADGINSAIRNHFFADDDVRSYHLYLWIYWLDKKYDAPKAVRQYEGKNSGVLFMPTYDGKCAVYLVALNSSQGSEFIDSDLFEESFKSFKHPIPEIVKSARKARNIHKSPIKHIETKEFYRGRVVLIGDAIHAMAPLTALGATLSIQDAYVLADELSKDYKNYRDAFKAFQNRRMKVIKKAKFLTNSAMGIATRFASKGIYKYMYVLARTFAPGFRPFLHKAISGFINSKL